MVYEKFLFNYAHFYCQLVHWYYELTFNYENVLALLLVKNTSVAEGGVIDS